MPNYEPVGKVIHRTDAKAVALPWTHVFDRLASESYYKVVFRQPGSHTIVDLMVFVTEVEPPDQGIHVPRETCRSAAAPRTTYRPNTTYRVVTTVEVFEVSFPHGKEKRELAFGWVKEDQLTWDNLSEALMAAYLEATLHHAHTKQFKPLDARR